MIRRYAKQILFCLTLCFSLTDCVFGDTVVYDNGAGGAAGIDQSFYADLDTANTATPFWEAEDVSLGSTTTITGIEWTGNYGGGPLFAMPPSIDDFTVAFFLDNAGSPMTGAPIASFDVGNQVNRSPSGFDASNGTDYFNYEADINFTMNAGTTYWVSIYGNTVGDDTDFYWGALENAGSNFFSNNLGQSWFAFDSLQDFRLTGAAVPEPSSTAFLGVCLIGGWLRRRRR